MNLIEGSFATFGDRSGLNRAPVGEIERSESNVTIQTLKIIANTLDVRIGERCEGSLRGSQARPTPFLPF